MVKLRSSQQKFHSLYGFAFVFESYVGVGKHEEAQLFYYFVESQRNPQKDPLFLYLTGGPGTSGILSFLYEIGNFLHLHLH